MREPSPKSCCIIEDAEWIIGTDHPESVARRVGYRSTAHLYDALRRWGRQDLVDRCLQWHITHGDPRRAAA